MPAKDDVVVSLHPDPLLLLHHFLGLYSTNVVREVVPPGMFQTLPEGGGPHRIMLMGGDDLNLDFGNRPVVPPVAQADDYGFDLDATLVVDAPGVLANDTDDDNDPLTAALINDVANGTLDLADDGSFTYTPDPGFKGPDSFSYVANDGTFDSNEVTVTLTLANDVPEAFPDDVAIDEDTSVIIDVLDNDTDPDGDPLAVTNLVQPANGEATLNQDNSITYTPRANFHGQDGFTYTANDGRYDSNEVAVTIEVSPVNDVPEAFDDRATTGVNTPVTVDVLANDVDGDGDPLSVTNLSQPANGEATLNQDDTITYTPDADFTGDDVLTYTASDGTGDSEEATVTITVSPLRIVKGVVQLQSRNDYSGARVTFSGQDPVFTDAQGNFEVEVPGGTYTVTVEKDGFLTAMKTGLLVDQDMILPVVRLLAGAVYKGGGINALDLAIPAKNLGKSQSPWTGDPTFNVASLNPNPPKDGLGDSP